MPRVQSVTLRSSIGQMFSSYLNSQVRGYQTCTLECSGRQTTWACISGLTFRSHAYEGKWIEHQEHISITHSKIVPSMRRKCVLCIGLQNIPNIAPYESFHFTSHCCLMRDDVAAGGLKRVHWVHIFNHYKKKIP